MNVNQIINMVMRVIMRKAINSGVDAGINAAGNVARKRGARNQVADQGFEETESGRPAPMAPNTEEAERRARQKAVRQARRAARQNGQG